jgi:hypothetical protein
MKHHLYWEYFLSLPGRGVDQTNADVQIGRLLSPSIPVPLSDTQMQILTSPIGSGIEFAYNL